MTLPFSKKDVSLRLWRETIERTQQRWIWFSKARQLDHMLGERLGTLVYLPQEIRDQIFLLVIDSPFDELERERERHRYVYGRESRICHRKNTDTPTRWRLDYEASTSAFHKTPTNLDVFELQSYHSRRSHSWHPIRRMPLHLTSPSTKVDFEYLFLRCTTFKFNCPRMLGRLLDQLSPYQQSILQHIAIGIHDYCSCCKNYQSYQGWMSVCTRLPSSLRLVTFELGPDVHSEYHLRGSLPRWKRGGHHHSRGRAEIKMINRVAELVEVLSKRIVRHAPKTQIAMSGVDQTDYFGQRHLLQVDHDLLNAAIGELEL